MRRLSHLSDFVDGVREWLLTVGVCVDFRRGDCNYRVGMIGRCDYHGIKARSGFRDKATDEPCPSDSSRRPQLCPPQVEIGDPSENGPN